MQLNRLSKNANRSDITVYSQSKGLMYTIIFALLLWWIPIAGPSLAGYLGGRKSGNIHNALTSSLVTTSVIIIITLMIAPLKTGVLGGASQYFSTGVLQFSQSSLIAYSGVLADLYTAYGIIKTISIIIPGSILLFNIFSFAGGYVSDFKTQEENLSYSFMNKDIEERIRTARSVPQVKTYSKSLKQVTPGGDDDEDSSGSWSYL
ncbi:MAG TPA: hypothetical protein VKU79_05675 [Thermoplasmataceae archaeon]|nr:hypothetical protein [Thermoplasmataceae archaeon]